MTGNSWVRFFFLTALLLPPLPLPGGDSGPHPAALAAGWGVVVGLARLGEWRFRFRPLMASFLLLFGVLLTSVPLAALYSGAAAALGSLARLGLFGISVYLFFYLAGGPGRRMAPERLIRLLFWAGVGSAAFACLDFYYQFPAPARFAEQFVWLPQGVFRRAQGFFYEASTLGSFCVFLLVLIASVAALRIGPRLKLGPWALGLGSLVLVSALAFSFSRAAMVNLVVALGAVAWLRRELLKGWVRAAGMVAAASLAGYAAFPDFVGHYWERLEATGTFLAESPNVVLSRRLETWQYVMEWISEHPWQTLWGVGYKTLPYTDALGRPVVVDNMYLSLLLETGWLGLAALLALNASILVETYRLASQGRLVGVWMFSFWCGLAVQMLTGDILTYWRILPAFFGVLALGCRDEDPVSGSVL